MRRLGAAALLVATALACGSSDGGSGASGPVLAPVTGPLDPSAAAKAAALLGSCIPDDGANRILQRIYEYHGALDYERDAVPCLAAKTNGCAGVTECTGVTADIVDVCTRGCDGDRLTDCDDTLRFRADCARFGQVCRTSADGRPSCVESGAAACNEGSFTPTCDGDRPVYCSGGFRQHGPACGAYAADCGTVAASNQYVCHGRGDACGSTIGPGEIQYFGIGCSGGSVHACLNGGATDVACASVGVGFTCQSTIDGAFFCGQASDCTPGSKKPTCDGTKIVVCNAGKTQSIDCTTLGFTTCSAGACVP